MTNVEQHARHLWQLLDDIDTLDDQCREHDKVYRERARAIANKRWDYANSDGYSIVWKDLEYLDVADRMASIAMFRGYDVDLSLLKKALVKAKK